MNFLNQCTCLLNFIKKNKNSFVRVDNVILKLKKKKSKIFPSEDSLERTFFDLSDQK